MKLSEISGLDDCKNQCPCYGEFCSGGMMCYGGNPIEPPCVIFPDDDADEFCSRKLQQQLAYDKWEDEQISKKKAKEEKFRIAKQKRHEYKLRNMKELLEIKRCEKQIKATQKWKSFVECFTFAVNTTNQMFRESGCDCPNDIKPKSNYQIQIDELNNKIVEMKAIIKQNEKVFKKNKENKSE